MVTKRSHILKQTCSFDASCLTQYFIDPNWIKWVPGFRRWLLAIKGIFTCSSGFTAMRQVNPVREKGVLTLIRLKVNYCLSDIGHKKLWLSKYHTAFLLTVILQCNMYYNLTNAWSSFRKSFLLTLFDEK